MKADGFEFTFCRRKVAKVVFLSVVGYWLLLSFSFASDEKLFEIKARKFFYTPHIINVNKGDTVKIRLISEDVHHGFFLDAYGVETSAYPGQEGAVKFVADKTGRFSFRCSVTCGEFHPYMIGYLNVQPNSRFLVFVALTLLLGVLNLSFVMLKKRE
jgi:cytochrome c oxidase subunit 2